jgi:hypothetical protein
MRFLGGARRTDLHGWFSFPPSLVSASEGPPDHRVCRSTPVSGISDGTYCCLMLQIGSCNFPPDLGRSCAESLIIYFNLVDPRSPFVPSFQLTSDHSLGINLYSTTFLSRFFSRNSLGCPAWITLQIRRLKTHAAEQRPNSRRATNFCWTVLTG